MAEEKQAEEVQPESPPRIQAVLSPSEVLRAKLLERDMSYYEFFRLAKDVFDFNDMDVASLREVAFGGRVDSQADLVLGRFFRTQPGFWMETQRKHDFFVKELAGL